MNKGKILLGILAGVAAGTAIGILIAPHKGWRTRKLIKRRAKDIAAIVDEKIEERIEDVKEKLRLAKCKSKVSEKSSTEQEV